MSFSEMNFSAWLPLAHAPIDLLAVLLLSCRTRDEDARC